MCTIQDFDFDTKATTGQTQSQIKREKVLKGMSDGTTGT
jgi:hypothetical protein